MPGPPRRRPARVDDRQVVIPLPRRAGARYTPEQLAKASIAKRPSPVGQPDKVELAVKLVVLREVAERLAARAIREGRKIEALMQDILGDAAADRI